MPLVLFRFTANQGAKLSMTQSTFCESASATKNPRLRRSYDAVFRQGGLYAHRSRYGAFVAAHNFAKNMHREDVSTPNAVHNSIYRRCLNGRAFLNDPDVFLLRRTNIKFTVEQQKLLAKFIKLFGSVLFMSDNIADYDSDQLETFKDVLTDDAKSLQSTKSTILSLLITVKTTKSTRSNSMSQRAMFINSSLSGALWKKLRLNNCLKWTGAITLWLT